MLASRIFCISILFFVVRGAFADSVVLKENGARDVMYSVHLIESSANGYGKLELYSGNDLVLSLRQEGYYFAKPRRLKINKGRTALFFSQVEVGVLFDKGVKKGISKEYCIFVSLPSGCIMARETGEICSGKWEGDASWVAYNGDAYTFWPRRITVERLMEGRFTAEESIVINRENLLRCDAKGVHSDRFQALTEKPEWRFLVNR